MPQDLSTAYVQLKILEDAGHIQIPEPVETKTIGTIDPAAGTFTFGVPVIPQTSSLPPVGGSPSTTNSISTTNVGYVTTTAAKLLLRFKVIPQQRSATTRGAGDVAVGDTWNGGVTIDHYPTVSSTADEIVLDIGHHCSAFDSGKIHLDPPVNSFMVTITFVDKPSVFVYFFAMRPPILGLGAFTLPALPVTIVYAPPQNAMKQNTVTYTSSKTLTRKFTTSLTNTTTTVKTDAYSIGDLIAKGSEAVASVAAFVGSGGASGVATAPLVIRALHEFVSTIAGSPAKKDNDDLAGVVGGAKDALTAMGNILQGLAPSISTHPEDTLSTEDDHSVTMSVSTTQDYGNKKGLGPGVGDRVVFMRNVRVVWMAIKEEVNLVILGYEAIGGSAVVDLQQSLETIGDGGSSPLGLDAATIQYLLALDPLAAKRQVNVTPLHGPVIGPPRFVPADPPGYFGTGTSESGDGKIIQHSTAIDDVHSTASTHTTVTDVKPGWINVMFGAADNTATTTTVTMTTTQTMESTEENEVTTELRLVSAGNEDAYDVKIFEDLLLKTYVILGKDSPLLHGVVGNSPERPRGGGGMAGGG